MTQGIVETYIHPGGRVGAMVELNCETDFVARTDGFRAMAREIAMQVAAMNPQTIEELLNQEYIRDAQMTVREFINTNGMYTVGERIWVGRLVRFEVGAANTSENQV